MAKRDSVFTVTENGETRFCKTKQYGGIVGVVLHFSMNGEMEGKRVSFFERLANTMEIDKNEFDEYLREPGKQMSLVEVNADENIIRINEDMQSEWICREYPLDLLVAEGTLQYLNNLQKGHEAVDNDYMYSHMDLILGEKPWLKKQRYALDMNGFTAIRVTENGNSEYFITQIYNTFPSVANRYQKYCMMNDGTPMSDLFVDKQPLSKQAYGLLCDTIGEHPHLKILIEFDLDNDTVKLLKKHAVGWESYSAQKVFEIADKMYGKELTDTDVAYFKNLLQGWELPEESEQEVQIPTM